MAPSLGFRLGGGLGLGLAAQPATASNDDLQHAAAAGDLSLAAPRRRHGAPRLPASFEADGILQPAPALALKPAAAPRSPVDGPERPDPEEALPGTVETADPAVQATADAKRPQPVPDERDRLPERSGDGVMEELERGAIQTHRLYPLYIDTGKLASSATHDDVYIQLIGTRGKTGLIHLRKGFPAGTRQEFSVYAWDVGRVKQIRLVADTPDKWFCDRVWFQAPEGLREFGVGRAIGWPETPEVTVMPANIGPAGAALAAAATAACTSKAAQISKGTRKSTACRQGRPRATAAARVAAPRAPRPGPGEWGAFL